jgi:hypothetical protein
MNSNTASRSDESTFYASLTGKSENWSGGTRGGGLHRGGAKHLHIRLGFVPCRNALVSKPSSESEGSDGQAELPGVNAPANKGAPVTEIDVLTLRSHSPLHSEHGPEEHFCGSVGVAPAVCRAQPFSS